MPGRVHESVRKLIADGIEIHEADTGDFSAIFDEKVKTQFEDPEINKSFAVAYSHFLSSCWSSSHDYLCMAFQSCESPIEAHLLAAIICVASRKGYRLNIFNTFVDESLLTPGRSDYGILEIRPQHELAGYRCDFLLSYGDIVPDFDHQIKTRTGDQIPGTKAVRKQVIVECDGHDFHERTKEQAKRDKSRDRTIQANGFYVFRYTGSEIWGNAAACADEILEFVSDINW